MNRAFHIPLVLAAASAMAQSPISYPAAPKADTVYDYAGKKVPDPYSWLENVDSEETKNWVEAENKVTFDYLHAIPGRDRIAGKLRKTINYERFSAPQKEGGRYFFSRNDGLQNQSVLYVSNSLSGPATVLLDPNKLRADGTVALNGTAISENGRLLAYALSSGGSDWQEWHVRNIDTQKDLPDLIHWAKFSEASWLKDGSGFFYERYDKPKGNILKSAVYNQQVFFHRLGTPQVQDRLIYRRPDHPDWGFGASVTDDGRYLVITASQGTLHENRMFVARLRQRSISVRPLFDRADAAYSFMGNIGSRFYFETDLGAPNGRVISMSEGRPDEVSESVVPQSKFSLVTATIVGGRIFCQYLVDAHSEVRVFGLNGGYEGAVGLPGIGSVEGFGGRMKDRETFYTYDSYLYPSTIYRYEIKSRKSVIFRKPKVNFDASAFKTSEVFFKSKDGTRVPMFLTYRKGLRLDGSNPTLMYGYGGFDVNETPVFSNSRAVWLAMGGVYADVVLRGGAEYGESWHRAGMRHNKQNVFDDFIAAGEYLIHQGYTSTPKLAIQGGSNGGLLIGAMITQRPDLWGATLPAVGVMDMLRFNKFTIGYAWMSEYGNPDTAADFATIYKYSPLHNIKPGVHYPPTLITTADHDDRVFPAHSFKFAATLQADQGGEAPILIRVETRAGHGAGMPVSKQIELIADEWAFLLKSLGMTLPDGF